VGHCSIAFVEKVKCGFARQVYHRFVKNKYGVDTCMEDDYVNFFIKRQILSYELINDPEACIAESCDAPCIIAVTVQQFSNYSSCAAPKNVSFSIEYLPFVGCLQPDDVSVAVEVFN
jgi:hypothetical protein